MKKHHFGLVLDYYSFGIIRPSRGRILSVYVAVSHDYPQMGVAFLGQLAWIGVGCIIITVVTVIFLL